jgi:hypothetical protein
MMTNTRPWNTRAVDLTGRLVTFDPKNPNTIGTPSETKTAGLSPFFRGTIVDFLNMNTPHYKYIVECCQYQSDRLAYLKVVCHMENQWVFPADDPDHPMFILVIPIYLNAAPAFSNQKN